MKKTLFITYATFLIFTGQLYSQNIRDHYYMRVEYHAQHSIDEYTELDFLIPLENTFLAHVNTNSLFKVVSFDDKRLLELLNADSMRLFFSPEIIPEYNMVNNVHRFNVIDTDSLEQVTNQLARYLNNSENKISSVSFSDKVNGVHVKIILTLYKCHIDTYKIPFFSDRCIILPRLMMLL